MPEEIHHCPHCIGVMDRAIEERHEMRAEYAKQVAKKRKYRTTGRRWMLLSAFQSLVFIVAALVIAGTCGGGS